MTGVTVDGAWFGGEPWARVLRRGRGDLVLVPDGAEPALPLDAGRWSGRADADDLTALRDVTGPVLDVGCGPGRMVRAAIEAGLSATGLDVSRAAVRHCRRRGLPVLQRSVFDPVPREGRWGTVLLLDGNVGIGGDPAALLARCRELLRGDGAVVAEVHADPDRDAAFTGRVVGAGASSAPFRWSQTGERALLRAATGFEPEHAWTAGGRRLLRLRAR